MCGQYSVRAMAGDNIGQNIRYGLTAHTFMGGSPGDVSENL